MENFYRTLRSKISAATHHDSRNSEKKEEFFKFAKTIQHGFPSKPTCFAYDSSLNILAVGTKTGFVKVFGAKGVEFVGQQTNATAVNRLAFLPNQGRLISLCEDQSFHLWEIDVINNCGDLVRVKECTTAGKLKKISCWCLRQDGESCSILIGTESGNVYSLDSITMELTDYIIYQDAVIQNIPDDYKLNPGAVEALSVHPTDPSKVLIGYNRGLIVLWDSSVNSARRTFVESFQVESICWHHDGEKFLSAHNDGSYVIRSTSAVNESDSNRLENKPFGPFPLKPIEKIFEKQLPNGKDLIVFVGGMPRSSYADKFVVTVEQKTSPSSHSKQVTFDFTSKVVDVLIVESRDAETFGCPSALMVLCEEELVSIDLMSEEWPVWRLPYAYSLHSSPIMSCVYAADVNEEIANKINAAGESALNSSFKFSPRPWPIQGGMVTGEQPAGVDYLITGHEDGTVKFWSGRTTSMNLQYVMNVARLFDGYMDPNDAQVEEEAWPPFRKVGMYDPYTDDPRYGVQRLAFDSQTGSMVVGCSAGQITVWELFEGDSKSVKPEPVLVDIVEGLENFSWKGQQKLDFSKTPVNFTAGYAPKCCLQLNPPAAITALALKPEWNVIAAGTAQGFMLFDYAVGKSLTTKCLLTISEVNTGVASSEGTVSRFKSFKKSLRDSFRKKRRQRSPKSTSPEPPKQSGLEDTAAKEADAATAKEAKEGSIGGESAKETKEQQGVVAVDAPTKKEKSSPVREKPSSPIKEDDRVSPVRIVERAVEARADADQLTSMVRSLYFCQTYPINSSTLSPTFWVGTNGGVIYVHLLTLQSPVKSGEDAAAAVTVEPSCQLAKEIRLKHRAPVLAMNIVDGRGFPLDNHPPISASTMPIADHGHRLIVVSEEQLKAFHLPKMSPTRIKFKVTASEGARIRKVQFVNLQSKNDENKWESFIVLMTNQGDVETFSSVHFRRYLHQNCVPQQMVAGVLSTVLTRHGEGFYLLSSSEWQRFSVGAKYFVQPRCTIVLPEGSRPPIASNSLVNDQNAEGNDHQDKKEEPAASSGTDKQADVSALSEESHNVSSTLPTDMTMDSIHDYTTETHTENSVTSTGVTMITTKVSKITVTEKKFNEIKEEMLNGDHQDEIVSTASKKITQDTVVVSGPNAIVAE